MYCSPTPVQLETSRSLSIRDTPRDWFAIYTRTHHEKRVVEHLTQRGVENYLPCIKLSIPGPTIAKSLWTYRCFPTTFLCTSFLKSVSGPLRLLEYCPL
jgi:hypothetical protein